MCMVHIKFLLKFKESYLLLKTDKDVLKFQMFEITVNQIVLNCRWPNCCWRKEPPLTPLTRRTGEQFTGQHTWVTRKWCASLWSTGRSSTVGTSRYGPHRSVNFSRIFLNMYFFTSYNLLYFC